MLQEIEPNSGPALFKASTGYSLHLSLGADSAGNVTPSFHHMSVL